MNSTLFDTAPHCDTQILVLCVYYCTMARYNLLNSSLCLRNINLSRYSHNIFLFNLTFALIYHNIKGLDRIKLIFVHAYT